MMSLLGNAHRGFIKHNNTEQGCGKGMIREFKRRSNNEVNDCR